MAELLLELKKLPPSSPQRPGRVQKLKGVIFQSDQKSVFGSWIIRPVEMLDRRLAGLGHSPDNPSLAMHVGIHVVIEDGREFVVEQLFGTPFEDFVDGLNWTPLETFRARDRGGWDVTIPATAFRGIDKEIVDATVDFLNAISVRPFFDEDCTTMVERAFGKRRLFADSPAARAIGFGLRVGDPALALLRADVRLDDTAEFLLRADTLRALPNPVTEWAAPNARRITKRVLFFGTIALTTVGLLLHQRSRARTWAFSRSNPFRERNKQHNRFSRRSGMFSNPFLSLSGDDRNNRKQNTVAVFAKGLLSGTSLN